MTGPSLTLTITLTGRTPVTIVREDWPVLAHAVREWTYAGGTHRFEVSVRSNADGRTIVYGGRNRYGPRSVRRGHLLPCAEGIPAHVAAVVEELVDYQEVFPMWQARLRELTQACIQQLPAERLS